MPHLVQDFRYGLRLFARSPGFTAVAVLILALGIGANTAMFSLVNAMVLQPRPGRIDSMVGVFNRDKTRPDSYRDFSYPAYVDLRERGDIFESLLAHAFGLVGIHEGETTRRSFVEVISANYFTTLGVPLAVGRPFTEAEERPGAGARVAIASYSAWSRRGRDPAFIGSTVRVNGSDFTIVGVAPRGFAGTITLVSPEWWFPLGSYDTIVNEMFRRKATGLSDRGNHALNLTGHLKPGVTPAAAERALDALAARLGEEFPGTDRDRSFVLGGVPRLSVSSSPEDESQIGIVGALLMLMSALVLVVACLNLANLLVARGAARRREIAIRRALGGGRGRIIQQLVVEGFTLALAGASVGLLLSWWSTTALTAWLAAILPLGIELVVEPSNRMLAAAIGFAVVATLLFAVGPAWRLSRRSVTGDLKGEPAMMTRRFRMGAALVCAQLAFSVALVTAGGLFMRGAVNAAGFEPGFSLDRQLVFSLDPSLVGYGEARTRGVYRGVLERVRSMAGVERASLASIVAFGEFSEGGRVTLPNEDQEVFASFTIVTSEYFDTLGLRLVRGRAFSAADDDACAEGACRSPIPVVIDVELARRLFQDGDPIGQPIRMQTGAALQNNDAPASMAVIGVAPPVRQDLFVTQAQPHVYAPFGRRFRPNMTLHVATAPGVDEGAMLATVQRELRALDARLPILTARTMHMQRRGEHHAMGDPGGGAAVQQLRRARPAAGHDWDVRIEGVRRREAHAGNRHSHGPRRDNRKRRTPGSSRRIGDNGRGSVDRPAARGADRTCAEQHPVPGQPV